MHDLRQEESSVADYFPVLIRQWQKIDLIDEFQWTCNKDEKLYRSIVENKRVFKFLMGLNRGLDDVRGGVLSTKPLPSLRAAFSVVRQEESRRTVILGSSQQSSTATDGSALTLQRHAPSFPLDSAPSASRDGQSSTATKGRSVPGRLVVQKMQET